MTFHQIMTHLRQGLTMKTTDRRDVKLMDISDYDDANGTLVVRDIATGLSETVSQWELTTEWAGAWKAPVTARLDEMLEFAGMTRAAFGGQSDAQILEYLAGWFGRHDCPGFALEARKLARQLFCAARTAGAESAAQYIESECAKLDARRAVAASA